MAAPPVPQLPPASTSAPLPQNDTEVMMTAPHPVPAGDALLAPGVGSDRHVAPPSKLTSRLPRFTKATMVRPDTASASGEAMTPALTGPSGDQLAPASAVAVSGVNSRFWLGRTATV